MLLPLLMDISTDGQKSTKKVKFFDYIYLDTGKRILKFKVEVNHPIAVANALENCINNINVRDFHVMSEKEIKKINTAPTSYLPFVGNFRKEDTLIRTNNYLVPTNTKLMDLLINMRKDFAYEQQCLITPFILKTIANVMNDPTTTKKDIKIINNLLSNIDVTLVSEYNCDSELLKSSIDNIEKIVDYNCSKETLEILRWILESSRRNVDNIKKLFIEDKFINAVKTNKQTKKVKS